MALVGDDLGDAIKAAIDSLSDTDKQDRTKLMRKLGTAIVDYFKTNAELDSATGIYKPGTLIAGPNPVTSIITPNTDVSGGLK